MTFSETVLAQIREVMTHNSIRQCEIARELGCSEAAVSQALSRGNLSLVYIDRLEKAFENIVAKRAPPRTKIVAGFYPNGLRRGRT